MSLKIHSECQLRARQFNGLARGSQKTHWEVEFKFFFFMESISIMKGATTVKKEAKKVQRQKSFFFAQIQCAFIQCIAFMP